MNRKLNLAVFIKMILVHNCRIRIFRDIRCKINKIRSIVQILFSGSPLFLFLIAVCEYGSTACQPRGLFPVFHCLAEIIGGEDNIGYRVDNLFFLEMGRLVKVDPELRIVGNLLR